MAITAAPRSASDATRFTATTPQATSTPATGPAAAAASTSRFTSPSTTTLPGSRRPAAAAPQQTETLEQRVARLRAAHLAAKNVQGSKNDRNKENSRRFFDTAHKVTVAGLI